MVLLSKGIRIILVIISFISVECSNVNKCPLKGKWKMIEWEGMGMPKSYDIIYTFKSNGEYTDSRSDTFIWNYEYYSPDSLILYHHGFYGERYKILKNTNDTLIMQMKESVFYGTEKGEDFEAVRTEEQPIFVFLRQ